MAKKGKNRSFGSWAFLIGFVITIFFGLVGITDVIAWILVVLGLIIGFLNVSKKETKNFLFGSTVLVLVSALGSEAMKIIPIIGNVLNAFLLLFIPATIIVALKSVFELVKD
ncbi:hypothetical protein CMO90_02510 [Candidatus Woesearchaeota archaeon]|jgi:hypothetical protein|nr:hypothetical protein [Candidatus Woesearchaeota archaeon]|tara:strand:- start:956 stop:1291 length:336 start_codon:yes stop_codon:yes gene_type:complete